jgi:hypothetical protein
MCFMSQGHVRTRVFQLKVLLQRPGFVFQCILAMGETNQLVVTSLFFLSKEKFQNRPVLD